MPSKLLIVALLCLAPSLVLAQRSNPDLALATQDIYAVAWSDGELKAVSRSYKAQFDPGSFQITPMLGRTAPNDYPLRVSLRSIRRGGHDVLLAAATEGKTPRLQDESVLYDYGDGIVERYDVRADGCKQSIVFAERPIGAGDLVVCYSVATEMACATTERASELRFLASDFGGITIGTVIGIDALGRRVQGHMAFDGQQLEMVLPHDFVETAAYPLELDPLFGPELNTGVSFQDHFPDTAYDATNNIYGVVHEFPSSATSSAVWIMRHDALTGTRLGGGAVGSGAGSQSRPRIANINQSDRFLVVWQDDASGNPDIKCRAVRASDGALSMPVTIASNFADELAPDVGGDAFDNQDLEALVVWQEVGVGIRGVQMTVAATGDPVMAGSVVTLDPLPLSANPTISKSGGFDPSNGGRYVVAWEADLGGTPLIGYLGVDRDLNLLTGPSYTAGGVGSANPDVDGDGTQFLLVFQALEGPPPSKNDIWCQPLEFCTAGTSLCGPAASPLANTVSDDAIDPVTACLGPMFAVAWSDAEPLTLSDYRIAITNVVPATGQLCGSLDMTGPTSGFNNSQPALCAKRSGGADNDEALLSFEKLDNSSGNSTLKSHRYQPFTGGPVTPIAGVGGCGTGGTADVGSPFAVGNASFHLTLRNADPGAPVAFLVFDTTMGAQSSCGTCTLINAQILSPIFPVLNGDADAALPLPCNTGLLGFTMDAQWVVFTPVAAAPPCPVFPFISASNAIRMVMAN